MRSLFRRGAASALLAAVLLAQALPWSALPAAEAANPRATGQAVRESAIEAPHGPEICPHHPEGCPADCMCPKTGRLEADPDAGAVTGPAIAHCTSRHDSIAPLLAAVYPPSAAGFIRPFPSVIGRLRPAVPPLFSGFRALPGKVPIA